MFSIKNIILKFLFLSMCASALFSCSAFDRFSKKADPVQGESSDQIVLNQNLKSDQVLKSDQESKSDKKTNIAKQDKRALTQENKTIINLEDKILLLEKKITSLENQLENQKMVNYKIEYTQPSQLYQKARTLLLEGDLINAAQLFKTFTQKHSKHSLADNAMYWLGECHYSSGQYDKAIKVFKELIDKYPKAEKVPDAFLKIGYSYLSMDDINRAQYFMKKVLKKYPFSPAAEKAQEKLKNIE